MTDQPREGLTIPLFPAGTRFLCPIGTCDWVHDVPPPPTMGPGVLAHIFGPGMMALQATNQHHAEVERALEEHFTTHPLADYVAEIRKLTELISGLSAQVAALTGIKRRDQALLDDLAKPKSGILGLITDL